VTVDRGRPPWFDHHVTPERDRVGSVLDEFDGDAEALATEVVVLRRIIEELRERLDARADGPFVVVSPPAPPERPPPGGPPEPWRASAG
jgi:hypothetical protein